MLSILSLSLPLRNGQRYGRPKLCFENDSSRQLAGENSNPAAFTHFSGVYTSHSAAVAGRNLLSTRICDDWRKSLNDWKACVCASADWGNHVFAAMKTWQEGIAFEWTYRGTGHRLSMNFTHKVIFDIFLSHAVGIWSHGRHFSLLAAWSAFGLHQPHAAEPRELGVLSSGGTAGSCGGPPLSEREEEWRAKIRPRGKPRTFCWRTKNFKTYPGFEHFVSLLMEFKMWPVNMWFWFKIGWNQKIFLTDCEWLEKLHCWTEGGGLRRRDADDLALTEEQRQLMRTLLRFQQIGISFGIPLTSCLTGCTQHLEGWSLIGGA